MIDAHQHFWQIARGDYAWMDDSVAAIRRDYLPRDLESLAPPLGIEGSVLVQAAPTEAETAFLLDLAARAGMVWGVVGWLDLEAVDASARLGRLAADPALKGIRPMLQDIDDVEWVLRPAVLHALRTLSDIGLSLDALITPRHLPVIEALAGALPDLRIVIDHCAKPALKSNYPGEPWRNGMARLARHPQIMCKLSGLATESGPGWTVQALRPVVEHVLACFGPERVMWGSDWPVLELAGSYEDWLAAAQTMTGHLSEQDRRAIFAGNASRFYRL